MCVCVCVCVRGGDGGLGQAGEDGCLWQAHMHAEGLPLCRVCICVHACMSACVYGERLATAFCNNSDGTDRWLVGAGRQGG